MPGTDSVGTQLQPSAIKEPIQLLVEGKDDLNFFRALLQSMGRQGVQFQNYDGVDKLRRFVSAFARMAGFSDVTAVGIVRDAERKSAKDALASVRGALDNAGLPAPSLPDTVAGGPPRVSVLILPDGKNPGMLESLLGETVRGTPVADCIDEFLKCAERDGESEINQPEKAFAHAFLATRPDPHVSVGVAAQKGYWDFDHPALDGVRSFVSDLEGATR